MSSSAIQSHSSQPTAYDKSFSESTRIDLYEVDETRAANDLLDKEAQAEQRFFIQNKKKELEGRYQLLIATGNGALWISQEMDHFLKQTYLATEANTERLKIQASERRRVETAARTRVGADIGSAKDDLKDFLARKEISQKQEVVSQNAVQKWRAELTNVSPEERRACAGLVNQFEQDLKKSRQTHFDGKIPEKKATDLLDREIAADNLRFESRCPKRTEVQAYVEKTKEGWAYGLTLASSDKKRGCQRKIERSEKHLDALEAKQDKKITNIRQVMLGDIPEVVARYTEEIKEECF